MKYRVLAAGKARLVPGTIVDGGTVDNIESLARLGLVEPYLPPKKKTKPKKKAQKAATSRE